ncbi:MAG TPA: DUF4403 family protein [Chitinophagaceae bacterium]|nr:DUF4403 family protein [Chitinophagaceae bacterium]
MSAIKYLFSLLVLVNLVSCSKKMIPEKPVLSQSITAMDTLPLSEIDVPVKVNLKPFYALAEKEVQQVYTSPGYPAEYVVDNCDSRYMYRFRRGPLQISSSGNSIRMGFQGLYTVAGGTRICTGTGSERIPVTPWTPTCTCGLREGERKVNVAFTASLKLTPDYRIQASINRLEPIPVDKCEVCIFNMDITSVIMGRLKAQLDDARKSMLDTLAATSLRPQFQKIWDLLNATQPLLNYGYLRINPQQIRISEISAVKDTMILNIGLTAKPVISQSRPADLQTVVPNITPVASRKGFSIYTDAHMDYDSLSNIINAQTKNKRIDLEMGKYIVIEEGQVYGVGNEMLILKIRFSGSASGEFYLTGKPVFDQQKKILKLEGLAFDIRSKNMMLRSAEWLFSKRILRELEPYTQFALLDYESMLLANVNSQLNKEIRKGVVMHGAVRNVTIEKIYPFTEKLVVRFSSKGELDITINDLGF